LVLETLQASEFKEGRILEVGVKRKVIFVVTGGVGYWSGARGRGEREGSVAVCREATGVGRRRVQGDDGCRAPTKMVPLERSYLMPARRKRARSGLEPGGRNRSAMVRESA